MKLSGIIAPLAVTSVASGAAILRPTVQGALIELHSTLGSVNNLVGGLVGGTVGGTVSGVEEISVIKTKLETIEGTLQKVGVCKRDSAVEGVTTSASNIVKTGTTAVDGITKNVEGDVQGATVNVNARDISVAGLESFVQGLFIKIESGEVTPEMILDTINPVAIQGLLDGALSNLVGIQDPVSGIEGFVQGVVFKIQSGALTSDMVLGALNLSVLDGLVGGVLGDLL